LSLRSPLSYKYAVLFNNGRATLRKIRRISSATGLRLHLAKMDGFGYDQPAFPRHVQLFLFL